MTANRDVETILEAWLDEGPTALPDATRRAIVTALPTTTQARRGPLAPWRFIDMNGFGRPAAVALVTVVAVGGLFYVLNPNLGTGTPSPSPVAPSETTAPTSAATMALVPFTSPAYGYSVQHPATWVVRPGTGAWPAGAAIDPDQQYVDRFVPQGSPLSVVVMMAAQPIPDGTTAEAWMSDWAAFREEAGGLCVGPASAWTDAAVADVAARRLEARCLPESGVTTNFVELVWVIDETGYIITGAPPSVVEQIAGSFQPG